MLPEDLPLMLCLNGTVLNGADQRRGWNPPRHHARSRSRPRLLRGDRRRGTGRARGGVGHRLKVCRLSCWISAPLADRAVRSSRIENYLGLPRRHLRHGARRGGFNQALEIRVEYCYRCKFPSRLAPTATEATATRVSSLHLTLMAARCAPRPWSCRRRVSAATERNLPTFEGGGAGHRASTSQGEASRRRGGGPTAAATRPDRPWCSWRRR